MMTLLGAVLAASLTGSLHCVSMCGIFAAIAASGDGAARPRLVGYNLARLVAYATMGTVAGGLGGLVDAGGALAGLQRASMGMFGIFLVAGGVISLTQAGGRRAPAPRMPAVLDGLLRALQRRAAALPHGRRAAAIGAVNALMPCGWLWTFVAAAASTGSAAAGSLVMTAFWLGGLPAMMFAGAGARRLAAAVPRAPRLTALLGILGGILVLRLPPLRAPAPLPAAARLERQLESLDPADRCCQASGRDPR